MKLPRISIGLDPHTLEMLEAAERVLKQPHNENPRWRTWFCKWAIMAVARAVAEAGEMPVPFGVDLRPETPEEMEERTGLTPAEVAAILARHKQKPEAATDGPVNIRFKWTPENLN